MTLQKYLKNQHAIESLTDAQKTDVQKAIEADEAKVEKATILKLIKQGKSDFVAKNLGKLNGLDREVALKLIEEFEGDAVAKNLERFTGVDHQELANKLIEKGQGHQVAENLEKFTGVDHQDLANKLIAKGQGHWVTDNLKKFTGIILSKKFADDLVAEGKGHVVAENLEKFTEVDHQDLAKKLIEEGKRHVIAENLEKFTGVDHQDLAKKLIEEDTGYVVAENLEKFHGVDHQELANVLMNQGEGYAVASNLEKFTGVKLNKEFADKLLSQGLGNAVANHLEKFTGVDHKELALSLSQQGEGAALINNLHKFEFKLEDLTGKYKVLRKRIVILKELAASPVQDLQVLKGPISDRLIEMEDPGKAFQEIEEVLVKNNLPAVGKIFKIFQILYPDKKINEILSDPRLSPTLRGKVNQKSRNVIIFHDLLSIHLKSGNSSFMNYLKLFQESEEPLAKLEKGEPLNEAEMSIAQAALLKLSAVRRTLGKGERAMTAGNMKRTLTELKRDLGVKPGQTLQQKVASMFLRPLGLNSIEEAIQLSQKVSEEADTRNRTEVARESGPPKLNGGDLVKGFDHQHLDSILQNGSVAKEFLGADAKSDLTPLDTDVIRLDKAASVPDLMQTDAAGYGGLLMVVRDRGQLTDTTGQTSPRYDVNKLEIFKSGVFDEKHYGVRTGIPSSEISMFIVNEKSGGADVQKIKHSIAKKGVYIPIYDAKGELLFTPKEYDGMRKIFSGIDAVSGPPLEVAKPSESRIFRERLDHEIAVSDKGKGVLKQAERVSDLIQSNLSKLDIEFNKKNYDELDKATLSDIGSTGRGTNIGSEADFDFNVKISKDALETLSVEKLKEHFQCDSVETYGEGNSTQYRLKGVQFEGKRIDLDIGFSQRQNIEQLETHTAIQAKLDWIKKNLGEPIYEETLANIRLAKKILKENGVYKKGSGTEGQGGLGGIGVETWILQNGGSLETALRTFYRASHKEGKPLHFEDFKKEYPIYGAGVNIQKPGIENFMDNMTPEGYQKMIEVAKKYVLPAG
jgi:hypothetical protein